MTRDTENRFSYGLILLAFGLIFLLDKVGALGRIPYGERLTDFKSLILVAGVILLVSRNDKKWGIVLTAVGVFLNANFIFGWIQDFSAFTVPIVLLATGAFLVLSSRK